MSEPSRKKIDERARRRVEQSLRESEAKFKALVEQIPAITYSAALDRKSTTLYVSPQVERLLGFTQAEYARDPDIWRKQLHPEDRDRVMAELISARVGNRPFISEYRMIARDGKVVWFRDEAMLVRDAHGKPLCQQGVMYNVTEERRWVSLLEKINDCFTHFCAAAEKNQKLITETVGAILGADCALYNRRDGELLVTMAGWRVPPDYKRTDLGGGHICFDVIKKGAQEPIVIRDLQGSRYRDTDPNVKKFSLQTYIGYPIKLHHRTVASLCAVFKSDFQPSEQELKLFEILARAAEVEEERRSMGEALGKSRNELEKRVIERTGELRETVKSLQNEIAARKAAEQASRQSETKLRTIADFTWDLEFWLGPERTFIYLSPSCERFTGHAQDEFLADDDLYMKVIHPEDRARVRDALDECYAGEVVEGVDFRLVRRDGQIRRVSGVCRPVHSPAGVFAGVRGSLRDISDRVSAEEALEKSEKNYREIVEGANSIIIRINTDGVIAFANRFAHSFFGYEEGELVGRSLVETILPRTDSSGRDLETMIRDIMRHADQYINNENQNMRRNGERVWITWTNKAVRDSEGRVIEILCIGNDITEARQREEEIRHLSSFPQMNPNPVLELSATGEVIFCNPAALRAVERMGLGDDVKKILPADVRDILDILRGKQEKLLYREVEIAGLIFGETIHLLPSLGVLRIYASDITDIKKSEEALRDSEESFRLAFEESRDAIFWADPETRRIIRCNRAAEKLTERSREEIVGQLQTILHPPEKADYYIEFFKRHTTRNGIAESEGEVITKSGKIIPVQVTPSVTSVGGRRIIQGIFRDITESRRREEQLLHAQKMEAVGTLTGGIAHDFNNILAGLMGYVSLMKMNLDKRSPIAPDLNSVEKLLQRGASLTGKLLAFSRRGVYQPKLISINPIVEEVLSVIRQTAGRGVDVDAALSPDVAAILADEGEMHQVVMNLCLNACEAMPEGGTLTVETSTITLAREQLKAFPQLREGAHMMLRVRDTGIGMDPQELKHIFEPFFTTKAKKAGTGLGLAVVSTIVAKGGGSITVESMPGKGSAFTVHFPASRGELTDATHATLDQFRGTETILMVDDEREVRVALARWLAGIGYTPVEAACGEEALRIMESGGVKIDLVLLDMVMRGMGGLQTFQHLKAISPSLPVIICTGYPPDAESRAVLERHASDFVLKPFGFEELARKIRRILDQRA